jgi:hypothetical protein
LLLIIITTIPPAIVNFSYDEKTQETQTAKQQQKLQDDSVFATSVPLYDNIACAAFTSTPERAFQLLYFFFNFSNFFILAVRK